MHQLDVLKITPNHLVALAAGRTGRDLSAILPWQWVVTGGEALKPGVARMILATGRCRLLNHYAPTETTVGVCTFDVTTDSLAAAAAMGAQTVPRGRPLANTRLFVVDAHDHEQPVGIPGVAQAVVVVRPDAVGESQLVAYAVPRQAGYAVAHADRSTREKRLDWLADTERRRAAIKAMSGEDAERMLASPPGDRPA